MYLTINFQPCKFFQTSNLLLFLITYKIIPIIIIITAAYTACGSSRPGIISESQVAVLDPLIHWASQGLNQYLCSNLSHCSQILNPLRQREKSPWNYFCLLSIKGWCHKNTDICGKLNWWVHVVTCLFHTFSQSPTQDPPHSLGLGFTLCPGMMLVRHICLRLQEKSSSRCSYLNSYYILMIKVTHTYCRTRGKCRGK